MKTAASDFDGQVKQEMRSNCFNNILTALNVSDNLHIIFAILEVIILVLSVTGCHSKDSVTRHIFKQAVTKCDTFNWQCNCPIL